MQSSHFVQENQYGKYQIIFPKYWLVEDRAKIKYTPSSSKKDVVDKVSTSNLLFHISENDYFGTLATVLSLLKDDLVEENLKMKKHKKVLENSVKDLIYLQKNYKISPK